MLRQEMCDQTVGGLKDETSPRKAALRRVDHNASPPAHARSASSVRIVSESHSLFAAPSRSRERQPRPPNPPRRASSFCGSLALMPAGYSGTPTAKKLGIKPGASAAVVGDQEFQIPDLPEGVILRRDLRGSGPLDVVLLLCARKRTLTQRFDACARRLATNGGLWVCWPKRASGVATDLTDSLVRSFGLERGLVDNKVCALDDTWSALRFVVRLRDRS